MNRRRKADRLQTFNVIHVEVMEKRQLLTSSVPRLEVISPLGADSVLNRRPIFEWSSIVGAETYELYVAPRDATQQPVIHQTGITGMAYVAEQDLAPYVYSTWVRGHFADGSASQWSEVATFGIHERGDSPVAVLNGVGQQSLNTPLITWEDVGYELSYELYISRVGDSSNPVYRRAQLRGTSHELEEPLLEGVDYNVWIRAFYDFPNQGVLRTRWGAPHSLRIDADGVGNDASDPVPFTDGTGNIMDTTPVLAWESRNHVARAELYINQVGDRTNPVYHRSDISAVAHEIETPLANNTRYEAWIRVHYTDGTKTRWGSPTELTIGNVGGGFSTDPIAFTGGTGQQAETTPLLEWEERISVLRYDLFVNQLGDRSTPVYRNANLQTNSHIPTTALADDTEYEVWIRAVYTNGVKTRWGSPEQLIIGNPAPDFTTIVPTFSMLGRTASWDPIDGAAKYELWINEYDVDGALVNAKVFRNAQITGTSQTLNLYAGIFRGWIRATNTAGEATRWSNAVQFIWALADADASLGTLDEQLELLTSLVPPQASDAEAVVEGHQPQESNPGARIVNRLATPREKELEAVMETLAETGWLLQDSEQLEEVSRTAVRQPLTGDTTNNWIRFRNLPLTDYVSPVTNEIGDLSCERSFG